MAAALKTAYLTAYNAASAVGWGYVLTLVAQHFQAGGEVDTLYPAVEFPLKVVQSAALLEVVHAALGLVRSSVPTTALQGEDAETRLGGVLGGATQHFGAASFVHSTSGLLYLRLAVV